MWIRRGQTTGTVVCIASKPVLLHSVYGVKLGLSEEYEDLEVTAVGRVGDVFLDSMWTPHPENYPSDDLPDEYKTVRLQEVSGEPDEPPPGEAVLYLKEVDGKRTFCLRSNNEGGPADVVEIVRET
jgi:hypothetical protein